MNYPNDFNIPAFPAGKVIAFSRCVAIWISVLFFLIIVACGFVLFGRHIETNYPFLISTNPFSDEWDVVAYPDESKKTIPQYQFIQEKLVNDYIINWFTISRNQETNERRWAKCDESDCNAPEQFNPENIDCTIYCKSDADVFKEFSDKVLPHYHAMINKAPETWVVKGKRITLISGSEDASRWQVYATISSDIMGQFNVLVFIDIDRDIELYPATFGYYVKQFNSYRITQ